MICEPHLTLLPNEVTRGVCKFYQSLLLELNLQPLVKGLAFELSLPPPILKQELITLNKLFYKNFLTCLRPFLMAKNPTIFRSPLLRYDSYPTLVSLFDIHRLRGLTTLWREESHCPPHGAMSKY